MYLLVFAHSESICKFTLISTLMKIYLKFTVTEYGTPLSTSVRPV